MTLREEMQSFLREGVCEIIFTKADGTERSLLGTLRSDYVDSVGTPGTGRESSDEIMRVIDVEIEEWRAFRIDSVKEFYDIDRNSICL